jgi:hypothetical protein
MSKRRSRAPRRKDDSRESASPAASTTSAQSPDRDVSATLTSTAPPPRTELDEVDAGWDDLLV